MPNALAAEKSPYLLQHAANPVQWLPWGEAAFAKARDEQKPIFLSIGYSTCHWCHVMAHESFEDEAIAELLNTHYVPVKVDREERPDVDKVYMSYVQALTGQGGWPLSAWLTPELKPFYGGTYFPPEDRYSRTGFPSLLRAIAKGWADERDKLISESERVIGSLRDYHAGRADAAGGSEDLAEKGGEAFEKCFQYFHESFDEQNGGFGGAPKFPRASNLNFLFRCAAVQGVQSELGRAAVNMAASTLQKMSAGGIHDHIGGGFHRYSVDDGWLVPHFEKMLYDQAQIAVNLLDAHLATRDERYAWVARGIFDYVQRDLTHPAGGFYSAEDADSLLNHGAPDHAEGAFYVWSHDELTGLLGEDAAFFSDHFGVKPAGNVPPKLDPHGEFVLKNILHQQRSLLLTAKAHGMEPEMAAEKLAGLLLRLREVRAQRPRPHLDDKIITAWNGLMISALARGAVSPAGCLAEQRESYRVAAVRAAEFVQRELYDESRGMLYRNYREGRGANEGFAEDYAYFIAGLLDLYEATFDDRWLQWADRLQDTMDRLFLDEKAGGYFNSAAGDASIILRLKEDYDGAEPTPGSVAAANLLRLAAITQDETRRVRGRCTIGAMQAVWVAAPQAMPEMLCAMERALEVPRQVVLAGDPAKEDFQQLLAVCRETLGPRRVLLARGGHGSDHSWLANRAAALGAMQTLDGRATAYVCENFTCQAPVTNADDLRKLLNDGVI
ncbi:MAG: thioredoxin domain-containing protein [Cephaloticoccus sp.]|nr:thioredoxin domain-containing protein [Cephaloticoccus sp.]MCF7761391.1 thioredoxin domain-containing protein [Cephaloticoccus sp.]